MNSEETRVYKIRLSKKAIKFILRLDKATATRIMNKIKTLETRPYTTGEAKQLTGKLKGLYRLRIGNYRAIYEIVEEKHIVIVLIVGPRGTVYG